MPDPRIQKVVMIVPGIRDHGVWIARAAEAVKELDEDDVVRVWPVPFGYFNVFKFLAPRPIIDYFVRKRVRILGEECESAREEYPNARLSFVGHSFGTHTITQFLKRHDTETAEYVILCGSVVRRDYKFQEISERIGEPGEETKDYLFNDCGNADPWPTVGARAGWIYGDIGTNGARGGLVTNRVFKGNHSFFKNKRHMKRYWANLIINGLDNQQKSPLELREGLAWYVKVLEKLPLNWIIAAMTALAIWLVLGLVLGPAGGGDGLPIPVDIARLEQMETNRLKVVESDEGKHQFQNWDEAFRIENESLFTKIGESLADPADSNPDLFLVSAPAASGKGKLAKIIRRSFSGSSLMVRYDRDLKKHGVNFEEHFSIPVVKPWQFKLPKPNDAEQILKKLIRNELQEEGLKAPDIKVLVVDGIDEVHPESREPAITLLSSRAHEVIENLRPRVVVFLGRAEGFLEFFEERSEEKPNVRVLTLNCPIPSTSGEYLAIWDDFERWNLRRVPADEDPANPTPTPQLEILDDKYTEQEIDKGREAFIELCKEDLLFRQSVSFLDILNESGVYVTKPPTSEFNFASYRDSITDFLLERNKGTHGRPGKSTSNNYPGQYLKVLAAIAAVKSSEVDVKDGYFTVLNNEKIRIPLTLSAEDGSDEQVTVTVEPLRFLCHSGFVELEPISSKNSPKRFRFVPIWMHKHLAKLYLENDFKGE